MTESAKVAEQRRLYGEPIGVLVRHITAVLGLTQARVAATIGLSPAMLSQLVGGQRVKIGNPLAVARLQSLLALAGEAPHLTSAAVSQRLDIIRDSETTLTTGQVAVVRAESAEVVGRVLHAVASGQQLDLAADAVQQIAPGLADLLRVHASGSAEDARRHLASLSHLL